MEKRNFSLSSLFGNKITLKVRYDRLKYYKAIYENMPINEVLNMAVMVILSIKRKSKSLIFFKEEKELEDCEIMISPLSVGDVEELVIIGIDATHNNGKMNLSIEDSDFEDKSMLIN